jgi:hypothetical protein
MEQEKKTPAGVIWGAEAIGREIGLNPRQTFYLLEKGALPATRVGRKWCSTRSALRAHFAKLAGGAAQ